MELLFEVLDSFPGLCALQCQIDDFLSDATKTGAQWAFNCGALFQAMNEVLDRVLKRRFVLLGSNLFDSGVLAGLNAQRRFEIITGQSPLGAYDDKATFGLGLPNPRVANRPPARGKG